MVEAPLPLRQEVIRLCQERLDSQDAEEGPEISELELYGFAYNDCVWIKYGFGISISEPKTQQYVHDNSDHSLFYTPKVYDFFQNTNADGMVYTYIIMERVKGQILTDYLKRKPKSEKERVITAVAAAVRHIWSLPIPLDAPPGPLFQDANQIPVDRFFSDTGVGRKFTSVMELQDWINTVLKNENRSERVDLRTEPVHLCHNDIAIHNIMINEKDEIVILDWEFSGLYPRAFEEYALINQLSLPGQSFAKSLHRELFGERFTEQMRPLSLAARVNNWGSC